MNNPVDYFQERIVWELTRYVVNVLASTKFCLDIQTFSFFPSMNDFEDISMRRESFMKTNFFQFVIPRIPLELMKIDR